MGDIVRDNWLAFNAPLEGVEFWMYLDTEGLVTTGIGFLIDPVEAALPLPWLNPDGTPASEDQIREEWMAVKNNPRLARRGAEAAKLVTSLRLAQPSVDEEALHRYDDNDEVLLQGFPNLLEIPADARLGIRSMAWAMGPYFWRKYPLFSSAIARGDFATAAAQCYMNGDPAPDRRNRADKAAFLYAASVAASGQDNETLLSQIPPAA